MARELDPNCTGNFVIRAGNVYFQAGKHGLYGVPCDGSSDGVQLDVNKGPFLQGDYKKALPHFRKALRLNTVDFTALTWSWRYLTITWENTKWL